MPAALCRLPRQALQDPDNQCRQNNRGENRHRGLKDYRRQAQFCPPVTRDRFSLGAQLMMLIIMATAAMIALLVGRMC